MKIGLARRGYSPSGGAERFLLRFADGLRAHGHDPVFFVDRGWRDAGLDEGDVVWLDGTSPQTYADGVRDAMTRGACDRLMSLERSWGCDVYRAGDGVHRAWLERRRAVEPAWKAWFRGLSGKHQAMMLLEESILGDESNCPTVVVNSQMVADEIASYYPDRTSGSIHLIYNGYDPDVLPESLDRQRVRAEVRRGLELPDDAPVVLFVGSGWQRKGLTDLVAAVRGQSCRLVVAGRGKVKSSWKKLENVSFLGPRSDVPRLLMAADVFALPTYYDPFSNATLEAARHGLPVVTTTANGFSEVMVDGVHGSAVEPGDVSSLAAAVDHWCSQAGGDAVFHRCLENAKPFTIERNVRETLQLIERV